MELLQKAKAEQKPLKESVAKQGVRINSLNASLHDKEKLVKKVTEENEKLVSIHYLFPYISPPSAFSIPSLISFRLPCR